VSEDGYKISKRHTARGPGFGPQAQYQAYAPSGTLLGIRPLLRMARELVDRHRGESFID